MRRGTKVVLGVAGSLLLAVVVIVLVFVGQMLYQYAAYGFLEASDAGLATVSSRSYDELKERVSSDLPEARFFDVSRYAEIVDLHYGVVVTSVKKPDQKALGYSVSDWKSRDRCYGLQEVQDEGRIESVLRGVSLSCDKVDSVAEEEADVLGRYEEYGAHDGVQVYLLSEEEAVKADDVDENGVCRSRGGLCAGSVYGTHEFRFSIDGLDYRVWGSYGVPPDASEEEANSARKAAEEELYSLVLSVLDQ